MPGTSPGMTTSLRRFLLRAVVLCRPEDLDGAAGLFDRGDCRFRCAVNLDIELCLDFATAEQPHATLGATDHAGFHQRFGVDGRFGVERLCIDRVLEAVEIDLGKLDAEDVGKAALRQPPVQRHLAALKALDAHARARGLTLAAAARGLALAGS